MNTMTTKKLPLRSRVVTSEKFPKKELLRIVKTKEGEILVDETGKINGRGAYIKKDLEVLEKAKKSKILERKLEIEIPEEVYKEVENVINKN